MVAVAGEAIAEDAQCVRERAAMVETTHAYDDAYLSAICYGGWRPVKARPKGSRVPDSPILTGFPRTNDKADRATDPTDDSRKHEAGLDVALSSLLSATLVGAMQSIGR
jgi:hypothetical protein